MHFSGDFDSLGVVLQKQNVDLVGNGKAMPLSQSQEHTRPGSYSWVSHLKTLIDIKGGIFS
jgi:hypothetical protein